MQFKMPSETIKLEEFGEGKQKMSFISPMKEGQESLRKNTPLKPTTKPLLPKARKILKPKSESKNTGRISKPVSPLKLSPR